MTTAQRESDLFITSMITDRIGRHEVLFTVPINHKNYYTISEKRRIAKLSKNGQICIKMLANKALIVSCRSECEIG